MLVFYFFISDVVIFQLLKSKLKTCHYKRRHSPMSLSTFNYSARAVIFLIQTEKAFYICPNYLKFICYRAIADTLQDVVHTASIPKKRTYIYRLFTHYLLLSAFQEAQTKGGKTSKQLGCLHFYIKQVVSNSELLVFYRKQHHIRFYGYVTNQSSTGTSKCTAQCVIIG